MEKDPNNPSLQLLEEEVPVVTGRKAARSLGLFRGDGNKLETYIDMDNHEADDAMSTSSELPASELLATDFPDMFDGNKKRRSMVEPVSSATYFPHTPVDSTINSIHPQPESTPETENLQHLKADLEFDRGCYGDITKLKKHPREEHDGKFQPPLIRLDSYVSEAASLASEGPLNDKLPSIEDSFPLTVELRPFKDNVGGHTAIFRFSKRAVCKALMNRENLWYEGVEKKHLDVYKFMPKYIGVLNVRYSSTVQEPVSSPHFGPCKLVDQNQKANTPKVELEELIPLEERKGEHKEEGISYHPQTPQSQTASRFNHDSFLSGQNVSSYRSPGGEDPPEVSLDDNRHMIPDLLWKKYPGSAPSSSSLLDEYIQSSSLAPLTASKGSQKSIGSTSVNRDLQAEVIQEVFVPKSRKSEELFSMDDEHHNINPHQDAKPGENTPEIVTRKHTRFERFILLEDLTADMHKVCALDLKMGTRQYGVDATDKKQQSQRKKCAATTSRELGVRVCGLQVWNKAKKKYFIKDKYFGRSLRSGTPFAKILAKFLYDGISSLSILTRIPSIIEQLRDLHKSFGNLNGYRMYGSSVLLMYDGSASIQEAAIKVHIIDFAQSMIGDDIANNKYNKPPKHPSAPDKGYLRGLESLIRYFQEIFKILTGDELDSIMSGNSAGYFHTNADRFDKQSYWISKYLDDEETFDPIGADDPFDADYGVSDDETCISD